MSFRRGERYERPPGTGPSWYLSALSQVRREALGSTPIRFELAGSADVVGHLDRPNTVVGPLGTVVLADGQQILAHDIEAFTLLTEPDADAAD